jgi:hypothetical protein
VLGLQRDHLGAGRAGPVEVLILVGEHLVDRGTEPVAELVVGELLGKLLHGDPVGVVDRLGHQDAVEHHHLGGHHADRSGEQMRRFDDPLVGGLHGASGRADVLGVATHRTDQSFEDLGVPLGLATEVLVGRLQHRVQGATGHRSVQLTSGAFVGERRRHDVGDEHHVEADVRQLVLERLVVEAAAGRVRHHGHCPAARGGVVGGRHRGHGISSVDVMTQRGQRELDAGSRSGYTGLSPSVSSRYSRPLASRLRSMTCSLGAPPSCTASW